MPQRPILYADDQLDHADARRGDDDWLRAALASADSRVAVVCERSHLVRDGQPAYVRWSAVREQVPGATPILLGVAHERAYFAVELAPAALPATVGEMPRVGLRDVVGELASLDATVLALAGALVNWNATHRFCPRCGGATRSMRAGHVRRCDNDDCARQHFPRSDPAVITLVIDGERCLLARRRIWPANRRSTIAGFVEPGETLEQAVRREVFEEVGVRVGEVRYRGSQPWPFPASLMLGFWARAETTNITVDGDEIAAADWYTRTDIKRLHGAGELVLPPADSISRRLVSDWQAQ